MTLIDDEYSDGFTHVLSTDEYDDSMDEILAAWDKEKPMAPINQREDRLRTNITLAGFGPFGVGPAIRDWMSAYALYRKPLANVYHDKDIYNDTQTIFVLRDGLSFVCGNGLRGMFRDQSPPIGINDTQHFTNIPSKPNESLSFVISPMISSGIDNVLFPDLVPFIPLVASMLVLTHKIPDIPEGGDLRLSLLQIVQIFNGSVQTWADPALNLGWNNDWYTSSTFSDPQTDYTIKICVDGRASYDNFALTMLLATLGWSYNWTDVVLSDWKATMTAPFNMMTGQPRPPPPYAANFREGTSLVQYLGHSQSLEYSISLSSFKEAQDNNAAMIALETGPGSNVYIYPDREALTDVVTAFGEINGTLFPWFTPRKVYPLVLLYSMVFKQRGTYLGKPLDCNRTTNMLRFWRFLATNKDLRTMPSSEPYVFMDAKMYYINRQRLKNITCYDSENPSIAYNAWELMKMEIRNESAIAIADADMSATIIFASVLTPTIAVCLYGTYELIILFFILKRIRDAVYKISSSEIFLVQKLNAPTDRFKGVIASRRVVDYHTPKSYVHTMYFGRYKAYQVMLRPCSLNIHRMNQKIKRALVEMMDHSQHPHVSTFYGISEVRMEISAL
ncbi:hypothetical protein RvY_06116-2 [Ramazzottius varieornatus]|uniref:PBP domain-containing protein n=1 Tax=Ramazzottius varieornatus TaxID=947166 RepID=A0A1D1V2Y5_RAMVA|nr:hypothetical protein RvY_06116-2 [Ramazzottius varieornatus]